MFFRWKNGGGGVALMHVYVWEQTGSLFYRTDQWMLTKLGREEVLRAQHMHLGFSTRSGQRWIQLGAKIGQ